jgi:5-(carboxyamino)imidazole ribonucleotide mutase
VCTAKGAKVAIVIGSDSDYPIIKGCVDILRDFEVAFDIMVRSAHWAHDKASEFAKNAEANEYDVIIAGAGKAAYLPGALAAHTILPVIGVPIKQEEIGFSGNYCTIAPTPEGVPVAAVTVNASANAGILAIQILALADHDLRKKLKNYKNRLLLKVEEQNNLLRKKLNSINAK